MGRPPRRSALSVPFPSIIFSTSTTTIVVIGFITCFAASRAHAQSLLPPAKQDGFVYTPQRVDSDTIVIEAFLDPVCPDSRDGWPPLKQALHYYGHRLWLVVHLLPLPYHDNAFVASRALHIVDAINSSSTFPLLELFFKQQQRFYSDQTKYLSRASIVEAIIKFSTQVVGNSYYPTLESGFNDRQTDLKTRVSFKYSTSRGVYGTPSFFVNGFLLPDAGSAVDFNGWRRILDPLIAAQNRKR